MMAIRQLDIRDSACRLVSLPKGGHMMLMTPEIYLLQHFPRREMNPDVPSLQTKSPRRISSYPGFSQVPIHGQNSCSSK